MTMSANLVVFSDATVLVGRSVRLQ